MVMRKGLMAVGVLAAAFAGGFAAELTAGRVAQAQEQPAKTISAQAFVLVDAMGSERGTLSVEEQGAKLVLRDAKGKERVLLGCGSAEGPYWGLFARDAEGRDRYVCGARGDGEGSGMGIWDWNGALRYGLGAARHGCGFILKNEEGAEIIGVGVGPGGGGGDLTLKHPFDGHVVWQASRTPQNPPEEADQLPPP